MSAAVTVGDVLEFWANWCETKRDNLPEDYRETIRWRGVAKIVEDPSYWDSQEMTKLWNLCELEN